MNDKDNRFLGTYFDKDAVLKWAKVIAALAWFVLAIYAVDVILGITVFALQVGRGFMVGLGPTDFAQNLLFILQRPVHGVLYFALLQALSKGLLIALDMEENTRRAARS